MQPNEVTPRDGGSLEEAAALVEVLMTAETEGGPKTARGAANTLLMAFALLLLDHPNCIPGGGTRGGGPGVSQAIAAFQDHARRGRGR